MDRLFVPYLLILFFSFLATSIIESMLIPVLAGRASQPIYEEGPAWHIKKKGTPTMGGLAFIAAISFALSAACIYLYYGANDRQAASSVLISLIFSLGNALIGVFDDLTKLFRKENAGLTPLQKIVFQLILAIVFLMAKSYFFGDTTVLKFSFGDVDISLLYYPLAIILLLGIVNCANLTDGIDGLAASVAVTIGIVFSFKAGPYLSEASFLSAATLGGALGFLLFNRHPAKIFMGDTGSLFLGALAVSTAFSFENPMIIIPVGGVYIIEGISVILQVLIFKLTKKRLFKMAPFHHHLEKSGFSENKICIFAVLFTLALSLISLWIF